MKPDEESLESLEALGALRYEHGSKVPYPTLDKYSLEQETAFLKGFRKASLKARLRSGAPDGYDFD